MMYCTMKGTIEASSSSILTTGNSVSNMCGGVVTSCDLDGRMENGRSTCCSRLSVLGNVPEWHVSNRRRKLDWRWSNGRGWQFWVYYRCHNNRYCFRSITALVPQAGEGDDDNEEEGGTSVSFCFWKFLGIYSKGTTCLELIEWQWSRIGISRCLNNITIASEIIQHCSFSSNRRSKKKTTDGKQKKELPPKRGRRRLWRLKLLTTQTRFGYVFCRKASFVRRLWWRIEWTRSSTKCWRKTRNKCMIGFPPNCLALHSETRTRTMQIWKRSKLFFFDCSSIHASLGSDWRVPVESGGCWPICSWKKNGSSQMVCDRRTKQSR